MAILKKILCFHGNHGSLATVKYAINVFMADPRGTLYVSCRFDINISKHFSIKLNLLNTAYKTYKSIKMAANTGKSG